MFDWYPYYKMGFFEKGVPEARYIPKKSQRIKNKRLRKRKKG
jgi:hypothetical protein